MDDRSGAERRCRQIRRYLEHFQQIWLKLLGFIFCLQTFFLHFNFSAILSNQKLLDDFNFQMGFLLPKIMELTPKKSNQSEQLMKSLRDFYLDGSETVTMENKQGFMNVS